MLTPYPLQPHSARLNHHTLKLLKNWTYQFVVIRPVCSILMIALQLIDVYPDWLSWTFTIILNVSVSLALYSLVIFYHVFEKELKPHSPLAKFLCIKGIVFFCFWQVISCLSFSDFHLSLNIQNLVVVKISSSSQNLEPATCNWAYRNVLLIGYGFGGLPAWNFITFFLFIVLYTYESS